MPFSVASSLFAHLMTFTCAWVVGRRSSHWTIRLLACTIALLPLCQAVILLVDAKIWNSPDLRESAQSMELLVSALCLTAVHLLNKENAHRKNTDARLRVAEGAPR
jgi:hypothetical protein